MSQIMEKGEGFFERLRRPRMAIPDIVMDKPGKVAGFAGLTWLSGLASGVGLMYLFDPAGGARRRNQLRDRARHAVNTGEHAVSRGIRDLSNRARGVVAETRGVLRHTDAPDEVVNERVRARLGRVVSHPNAIETRVTRGVVQLGGQILSDEVLPLLRALHMVPGVRGVENRLEQHDGPGNIPGLQGERRRPGPRFELLQANWSPGARFLVGGTAGALLGWAGFRGGMTGLGVGAIASSLLARAIANRPVGQLVGRVVGRAPGAFTFSKTIHVRAPIDEVYAYFSDLRNFPRFMSHVKDIRMGANDRSHWVVEGPAGTSFSWDAQVTRRELNHVLAWRTLPGAEVENAGIVHFAEESGGTRVQVQLSYSPPAGALGHVIAHLFGKDPKQAMDDDLLRFKSLLELGKATGRGHQVRRDELSRPMRPEELPH